MTVTTKPEFSKAKRYVYAHTEHSTTFDGNETTRVAGNLTASIGGNYQVTADKITLDGPMVAGSTASINGNLAVGGTVDGIDVAAAGANLIDANASVVKLRSNIVNANASLSDLQTNIVNANASIERANASIDAIQAFNLIKSIKSRINYDDLTATGNQSVVLFRASPGDTIYNLVGMLATPFGQPATPQRTKISVGDLADPDGFGREIVLATPTGWQWMSDIAAQKGEYLRSVSGSKMFKNYSNATLLHANFTASNMWLASFGKGIIDIYIDVMSRA